MCVVMWCIDCKTSDLSSFLCLELKGMESSERKKEAKHPRYKTRLCRHWLRLGECERGTLCNFAHGLVELRKPPKDVVMVNINDVVCTK